jgi:Cytochrome C'
MKLAWEVLLALSAGWAFAQSPDSTQPSASMKQLMLDLIHPSSNDILLFVNRGGPKNEAEWAAARRGALTLAESGRLLVTQPLVRDQGDWTRDVKMLAEAGAAAYKAAQQEDRAALAAVAESLDSSCTTCHRQYRPNVFPRRQGTTGGSK